MPVQYKDSPKAQSIIESTKHCREKAGLFDVSHMCSIRWRGKVLNTMNTAQLVNTTVVATYVLSRKKLHIGHRTDMRRDISRCPASNTKFLIILSTSIPCHALDRWLRPSLSGRHRFRRERYRRGR
jgi:glycine cleavage system aminomethyltransferase T